MSMKRSAFVAAVAAVVMGVDARAIETASPAAESTIGIEEVVVTAQRRAESLQQVPVSITAFGAEAIRDMRVDEPTDLAQHVPNLSAASTLGGGAPIFALRGVSMNDYSPNQSSPVAMYTDEVYRGTPALMGPTMYDLERVEVLRGPQGTLYGKNTTGGAINFITVKPGYDTEGYVSVGFGNYQRWEAQGAAQTGLSDTVAARIAFTYAQADGVTENLLPGKDDMDGLDLYGVRGSLLWEPTENLSMILRAAVSESSGTAHGIEAEPGPAGIGGGLYGLFNSIDPVANPRTDDFREGVGPHQNEANRVDDAVLATDSISLTVEYTVSDQLTLTSITSWDDGSFELPEDSDGSSLDVLFIPYDFDATQITQDLRLTSRLGGPFDYIVGAYLSREVVEGGTSISVFSDIDLNVDGGLDYQDCIDSVATIGTPDQLFPAGCTVSNDYEQTRDSAALYFDGGYQITDTVRLRFGVRYTHDDGEISNFRSLLLGSDGVALGNLIPGSPDVPGPATRRSYADDKMTGRIGMDFQTAAGNLLYATLSQGYRSSAFNGQAFFDPSELNVVKPEQLLAAEAGFKLDLQDDRLRLNGAVFWYGYDDQQFLNVDTETGAQQLVNVPESTIYGGEVEAVYEVSERLRIDASMALLQSEIDRGSLNGANLAGNTLPLAPDLSLNLGATWQLASLPYGDVSFRVDGNYVASQYFDVFNVRETQQDSYAIGNARLSLRPQDRTGIEFAMWAKNFTDEEYRTSMINLLDNFGYVYTLLGTPRTYGMEATWRF
jgi:iron complex outermembrane receptor protein